MTFKAKFAEKCRLFDDSLLIIQLNAYMFGYHYGWGGREKI